MDDNWRKAIAYICLMIGIVCLAVLLTYSIASKEFTLKFETDNNTLDSLKSMEKTIEKVNNRCYAITHEVWAVWDFRNNIIYNKTQDLGYSYERIDCPSEFVNVGESVA